MKAWGAFLGLIVGSCFAETSVHEQIDAVSSILMTFYISFGVLLAITIAVYITYKLDTEANWILKWEVAVILMTCLSLSWGMYLAPWHLFFNELSKTHDNLYYEMFGMMYIFLVWLATSWIPIMVVRSYATKRMILYREFSKYLSERLHGQKKSLDDIPPILPAHKGHDLCVICTLKPAENVSYYTCGHNFACRECFPRYMAEGYGQCQRCKAKRVF